MSSHSDQLLTVRLLCEAILGGRHVEGALRDGDEGPWLAREILRALDGRTE